jgi:uncharacterized membrane protein
LSIFKSPFERLSVDNLTYISTSTQITAEAVSPGGILFGKVEEMVRLLKTIAKNTANSGKQSGGNSGGGLGIGNAIALKIVGGKGLEGIGKGLAAIVDAIESMKSNSKEFKAKAEALVLTIDAISKIGPAILKFAGYLFLATPLLIVGMIAAPLFGLALFIIAKVLQFASKPLSDPKTQQALIAMGDVAKAILLFGVALVLASVIYPAGMSALPYIVISLLAIGGLFFLLDKMGVDKSMKRISIGLMFAAGAIVLLGLAFLLVDTMYQAMDDPAMTMLMIAGMVVGTAVVFWLAGKFAKEILLGSLVMIFAAIPIILLGVAASIFAASITPDEAGWITIGQIGALVTGVGLVMGLAGVASAFILAGAAAMIVAGLALVFVSLGAAAMAKLFSTTDMTKMLGDSGHETEGFMGFGGGRMMSNMEWLMLSIARSFTLNPLSIGSMYATAPAMILVGAALATVAYGIKKVQDLKIDYEVLPDQIGKLVTVLAGAFGAIGERFPGGRAFLFGSQSAVADGIDAVLGMGDALASIAQGVQAMADLKFPIYTGTKITGYYTLSNDTFKKVNDNINLIVNSLSTTFGELGLKYPGGKSGFFASVFGGGTQSPVADGIAAVMGMGEVLTSIAGGVQAMANLKFPIYTGTKITGYTTISTDTFPKLDANIKMIVDSLSRTFGEIGLQYPGGQKSLMNMIFGGGGNAVTDGIGAVMGMGDALAEIAKGVQAFADLKIPIYKNGKISGYESMSPETFVKVEQNIRMMVLGLTKTMGEIGNNPDAQSDWGWFGSSKIEDGVEVVTSFADPIKKIADAAKTFMETNVDPAALNTKIQGVISGMTGALSSAGNDTAQIGFSIALGNVADKMKVIAENIDPWVKFVDNFKKYVDDMGRLKDTLNAFDKVNLKFTSDMFQGLAYLSGYKGAGSINQMSSALNDSIKQLTLMIEEFKKSVVTPPAPVTSTVPNTSPVKAPTGPAAPVGKPNPVDSKPSITIQQLESMLSRIVLKVDTEMP